MAALLAVVAVSMATLVAVSSARKDAQREKEAQLQWIGDQFRQALRSYQAVQPVGGVAQYPRKLEELVEDPRLPKPLHHLRRLYPDPFTGLADWVPVREGDRIIGVHSRSTLVPISQSLRPKPGAVGAAPDTYAQWVFMATDAAAPLSLPGWAQAGAPDAPGNGTPAETPPPPPDPVEVARGNCTAQYGVPSITCKGPNFPFGNDPRSCRGAMAAALDQCLSAASGLSP